MKRIFGRTNRDYRLFAAALAFGFTATLATVLIPYTSSSRVNADGSVVQQTASRSEETSTVAFAYATNVGTTQNTGTGTSAPRQHYISTAPAASAAPLSMTEVVAINKGDTLGQVFEAFGIPKNLSAQAISSLKGIFSPREFRIGQQITLLFKPNEDGGRDFRGYRFTADPLREVIIMDDAGTGVFDATVIKKELKNVVQAKSGIITGSVIGAARRAGVPNSIINEMIRVYSQSIDFQRDVHEGDRFEIMYEAKADKSGKIHGGSKMMYAQLTLRGKEHPIYRFERNGAVDFYKADGSSNRRGLLKTPIDGARMSSGYGMRRHPVLGYSRMHKGIDFAAPTGTPIFAAGDGVIRQAGWVNGYGRYIKITHNSSLATAYAHMSRFATGIRVGVRVKQGQVIGYVGTTGRSTGPHLHYEIVMNGKQVNPVGVKVPNMNQLAGRDLNTFKAQISKYQKDFKQALAASRTQTASR